MFCFEGGFVHVDQPIRGVRTKQQLHAQGPPAWLQSFLESKEYLLKCHSNCFSGKVNQDLDGDRIPRLHRRRYFCTECPEEGAVCLGRIVEAHLRHPILKVRKVKGTKGAVIKVGDIEPLLDISYVAQHSTPNNCLTFVKLKTRRQAVWGAGSKQEVPCFECLQVASTDLKQKYCSIKCAYPNTVEPVWTSTAEDLMEIGCSTGPMSCRITRGTMHGRKSAAPEIQLLHHRAPAKSTSAPQSRPDRQHRKPSKGCLSRVRNLLNFGSSKKTILPISTQTIQLQHVQLSEVDNNSPSVASSSPDRWSSRRNFGTRHVKESGGEQLQRESNEHAPSRLPSRNTSRGNGEGKDRHRKSFGFFKEGGARTLAQEIEDSGLPKSACTTAVSRPICMTGTSLVNGFNAGAGTANAKAGPVTSVAWRSEQDSREKEEVQTRWGDVRNRVLNSVRLQEKEANVEVKESALPARSKEETCHGYEGFLGFLQMRSLRRPIPKRSKSQKSLAALPCSILSWNFTV